MSTIKIKTEKDLFNEYNINSYDELENALKKANAMDIVIKKWVNTAVLIHSKTVEEYNNNKYTPFNLTSQEFDLVKRYLYD